MRYFIIKACTAAGWTCLGLYGTVKVFIAWFLIERGLCYPKFHPRSSDADTSTSISCVPQFILFLAMVALEERLNYISSICQVSKSPVFTNLTVAMSLKNV